ncbi:MAG: PEP-CTERM sorting domain-containing protein [Candidatus Korobacteraceae bacterium]
MNFGRSKTILLATLFALVLSASAFADTTLYSQAYDNNGYLNASQNDTSNGGLGNFATTYDNWNINPGGLYTVNEVQFTGGYYNGNPGTITGWTVNVYFDNGGIPGTLQHTDHISGNGNETLLGGNIYTYDIGGLGFTEASGVEYWLSVVPDLSFPPQWGWATGTGGDGAAYQSYFGQNGPLGADQAFTLIGTEVPEPGTLVLLGTGVLGLAGAIRRKLF